MNKVNVTGTWELVRTISIATDGSSMPAPYGGEGATGLLQLSPDGRMMAVLCDGRQTLTEGTEREYASYCGDYQFDGQQLITKVDASSKPEWFGTEQVRDVSFEGDLMVLRPPVRAYAGAPEQRTLYWRKLAP